MGFIDRMRAYANQVTGGKQAAASGQAERSPLELDLIGQLQEALAQDSTAMVRYHLRFTGNVQGVGFRWTNQGTANELHLTGWVKNLSDGSVEMEIQGPCGGIIKHLDTVHAYYARMRCRVWLVEATKQTPQRSEAEFSVRYEGVY